MLDEIKHDIDSNVMPLLGGIIEDSKLLLMQELALIKSDIREQSAKAKTMAISLAIGGALALVGGMLLGMGFAHLLASIFPVLALWQCYGLMGILFGAIGFGIIHNYGQFSPESQETPDSKARSQSLDKKLSGVVHG